MGKRMSSGRLTRILTAFCAVALMWGAPSQAAENECRLALKQIRDNAVDQSADEVGQALMDAVEVDHDVIADHLADAQTDSVVPMDAVKLTMANVAFHIGDDQNVRCFKAENVQLSMFVKDAVTPEILSTIPIDVYAFLGNPDYFPDYSIDVGSAGAALSTSIHYLRLSVKRLDANNNPVPNRAGNSSDRGVTNWRYAQWARPFEGSEARFVLVLCARFCGTEIQAAQLDTLEQVAEIEVTTTPDPIADDTNDTPAMTTGPQGAEPITPAPVQPAVTETVEAAPDPSPIAGTGASVTSPPERNVGMFNEPFQIAYLDTATNVAVEGVTLLPADQCARNGSGFVDVAQLLADQFRPDCLRLEPAEEWSISDAGAAIDPITGQVTVSVSLKSRGERMIRGIRVSGTMSDGTAPGTSCGLTFALSAAGPDAEAVIAGLQSNGQIEAPRIDGILRGTDPFTTLTPERFLRSGVPDNLPWRQLILTLHPQDNSVCKPASGMDQFDLSGTLPQNVVIGPDGIVTISDLQLSSTKPDLFVMLNTYVGLPPLDGRPGTAALYPWGEDNLRETTADFLATLLKEATRNDFYRVFIAAPGENKLLSIQQRYSGNSEQNWDEVATQLARAIVVHKDNYSDFDYKGDIERLLQNEGAEADKSTVIIFGRSGFDEGADVCAVNEPSPGFDGPVHQIDFALSDYIDLESAEAKPQLPYDKYPGFDCGGEGGVHWAFLPDLSARLGGSRALEQALTDFATNVINSN